MTSGETGKQQGDAFTEKVSTAHEKPLRGNKQGDDEKKSTFH